MFNTELGRTSNTSNSSLAGGSTPAVGSLFWLANQSGSLNQTAPHQMSEFYGYSTLTDVTINIGTQTTADGSGNITVYAWTTGNVTVNTNVTVQFLWTGDLFNTINNSVIIYSGNSCSGGNTFGGADIGEYTSTFDIASLTPTTSSTQNYLQGSATTPVTGCP
jgi:hypothetical protein